MEINIDGNIIEVEGNIKSLDDFEKIKKAIEELLPVDKIILNLKNSISITSSVIGYLNKLVNVDNIDVYLKVKEKELYELLKDLELYKVFHIIKV